MGTWEHSSEKPPLTEGVYRIKIKETYRTSCWSYWTGKRFSFTSGSKESADRNRQPSPQGEHFWWYDAGDDFYRTTTEQNQEKDLPARNGALWSTAEEQRLREEWTAGTSIKSIALNHARVPKAIEIRLERLYGPAWNLIGNTEKMATMYDIETKAISATNIPDAFVGMPGYYHLETPRNNLLLLL